MRGFTAVQAFCDNEFNCIQDRLAIELKIGCTPVARGAHEPHIKLDNKTSKERNRCSYAAIPFERLPPRMVIEMAVGTDFWLNYWCSSGGILDTIPPREIVTGIKLDATKHCKFQFGDYILAHTAKTDNTMKVRARDLIYLRPTGNTNDVSKRSILKVPAASTNIPEAWAYMTQTIIDRVHAIIIQHDVPISLTFGDFNNESTILDIDTSSIVSEDEDDNASDPSYLPDNDSSTDTILSGVEEDAVSDNNDDDGDSDNANGNANEISTKETTLITRTPLYSRDPIP